MTASKSDDKYEALSPVQLQAILDGVLGRGGWTPFYVDKIIVAFKQAARNAVPESGRGPVSVHVESVDSISHAGREFLLLAEGTAGFSGKLPMVVENGLCIAVTGTGPLGVENANRIAAALNAAPVSATPLTVTCGDMHESNGRVTWVVFLRRHGDDIMDAHQVYADEIEGRAKYEAAKLMHFLGQGPEPDILAFDTDARTPASTSGHTYEDGLRAALEDCEKLRHGIVHDDGFDPGILSRMRSMIEKRLTATASATQERSDG